MLYAKSPAAYRLVQNILILPSAQTLRNERAKAVNKCRVGIQDGVISRIACAFANSEEYHNQLVVLCLDEMTIKG